jgi:PAS domain S-box-containing protein
MKTGGQEGTMSRILVLMDHKENRRLLAAWLATRYTVLPQTTDGAVDEEYDLGILDGTALDRLADRIQDRKKYQQTVFLPFLLVTAEQHAGLVTRHLWKSIDEVIHSPLNQVELQARVEVLLRARRQAVALRQAGERALRHSEERLGLMIGEREQRWRVTLASIGDAVVTTDTQGRVAYLNAVAQSLTGWTDKEAEGHPLATVFRIINEQTRLPVEDPVGKVLREGVIVGLANHTVLIAKDGTERPIDDSAAPIRCNEGKVVGCVLVFRDISERRRLEQQIIDRLAAARFLASIVESSDDAIVSKSLDGTIQSWNTGAQRLFKYTAEEAVGHHISLIIPADRADEEVQILTRLCAGERVEHFETLRLRSDGQPVHVSLTISPIKDEAGEVIGASKIARDITERKRADERLRESEARKTAMFEAALDCIISIDQEGTIIEFNAAAERTFGHRREDVLGRELAAVIIPPAYRERHRKGLAHYLATGEGPVLNQRLELSALRADGTEFPVELTVTRIPVDGPPQFTAYLRDITERKVADDKLRELAARLSEADRRKNEFLATLAHELRNPLAPIRNGLQIMRLSRDSGEAVEQARTMIERQLEQMVRLVDDLLDVSRIGQGKLELRKERVELATVLKDAVETSRPVIEASGHELTVSLPPKPVFVDADLTRLAQVFSNLLNNAAKYTEQGGHIWLTASVKDEGGRMKDESEAGLPSSFIPQPSSFREVVVKVRDTGLGIPADMLPKIFEMFTQVDRSLERSQGGLGVGLTLVRRLVEMHGGSVAARSDGLGKGSEFTVRLPVAETATQQLPKVKGEKTVAPAKRRILVVDDNKDSADSLSMMLSLTGMEVRTAYDGLEAVEAAAAFHPDVVLLDIGMPKLNGYEVARQIREQPWGKDMVLVAVTGWGQQEDRRKSHEAGFNGHMVKPVDHAALMKLLGTEKGTQLDLP